MIVDVLFFFSAGYGLVEGKVNLEGFFGLTIDDLGHRRPERLEIVGLGLVNQDIAISKKEDAFLGP